jgi:pimeloyl-ACP methyl ester carboxylesterase
MHTPFLKTLAAWAFAALFAATQTAERAAFAADCGSQWTDRSDPASVLKAIEGAQSAEEYQCTTKAFVRALSAIIPPSQWCGEITLGCYRLQFVPENLNVGIVSASDFDSFVPSEDVNIGSFRSQVTAEGEGVSFVGVVSATPARREAHPFMLPLGMTAPVTMVLEFAASQAAGERLARLTLYDPSRTNLPLAADYTAPFAYLTAGKTKAIQAGHVGMFDPEADLKNTGLIIPEVYRGRRIPVILVHGLDSRPITFADTVNELQSDPEILANYSFWFFRYPTGFPVPFTAKLFRDQLQRAQAIYNPGGRNPHMDRIVLIGHSMGGLLSQTIVSDSGSILWREHFDKPIDQVNLPPELRDKFQATMFWNHQPYVKRVVFVSTPHRGSEMATGKFGAIGDKLIRVPNLLTRTLVDVAQMNPDAIISEFRTMNVEFPTGIDNLKPTSKFLLALDQMPIRVPYHTILGDRGKGDSPNSSDGIVPYWSSHMDGAQSEVIVDSGHSSYRNPVAVEELKRILRLHLQETSRAAVASKKALSKRR